MAKKPAATDAEIARRIDAPGNTTNRRHGPIMPQKIEPSFFIAPFLATQPVSYLQLFSTP